MTAKIKNAFFIALLSVFSLCAICFISIAVSGERVASAAPVARQFERRAGATKIIGTYDSATDYTSITGFDGFGEVLYTADQVKSDGMTIDVYFDSTEIVDSSSIGIFLSEDKQKAVSEQSHFVANFWFKYGSWGDLILDLANTHCAPYDGASSTRVAYADYACTNPILSNIDGTNVARYQFYNNYQITGYSLDFKKYDSSVYKVIISLLYGKFRGVCESIFFVPAKYVPDNCYVGIYGNNNPTSVGHVKIEDENRAAKRTIHLTVPGGIDETYTVALNSTITLPAMSQKIASSFGSDYNGKTFVGYIIDGNLYLAGESITVMKDLEVRALFIDFSLKDGASVRKKDGLNESGIKFKTELKLDSECLSYGRLVTGVGVIMMPTDMIDSGKDFTIENYSDKVADVFVPVSDISFDADVYELTASIVKLYSNNFAREFSARNYIKTAKGISYGEYTEADNSRKIYDVSVSAIKAGDTADVLKLFVHGVLNITFNGTTASLVLPLGSSDTVSSLNSVSVTGGVATIKVNVTDEFINTYGGEFSGLIYNGRRIRLIDGTQSLSGKVMTITVGVE